MTTSFESNKELSEILHEFAVAQDMPSAELLNAFAKRYPHYAQELTEFAVALTLRSLQEKHSMRSHAEGQETSIATSKAVSTFWNTRYALQKSSEESIKVLPAKNLFAVLSRDECRVVTSDLGINVAFFIKLRDRQVEAESIPAQFIKRCAAALGTTVELVKAHFEAPSELQYGMAYKAAEKPSAGPKQSFEDAVCNSGLAQEQRLRLLSLKDSE